MNKRPIGTLSPGEIRVLVLAARGLSNRRIAAIIGVKLSTVKSQLEQVYQILDVHNRLQATLAGQRLGIVP